MVQKPSTVRPGTVQRIIKPVVSGEPEKAEIAVEGADELYKEIRIENTLTRQDGEEIKDQVAPAPPHALFQPANAIQADHV